MQGRPTPIDPTSKELRNPDATQGALLGLNAGTTKTPNAGAMKALKVEDKGLMNTPGDNIYKATKTLETIGRVAQAAQRPQVYRTDRYDINRQVYNPQPVLERNNRAYRAQRYQLGDTGSPTATRAYGANAYASLLNTNRDVMSQYRQMQAESDRQMDMANVQSKAQIDQMNDQNRAAQQNAISSALTSVGNLGQVFMDASNARRMNNVTLTTLNSLSRYYGVDVEYLQQLMKTNPAVVDQMLVNYKGDK
jgi:hypothetical protein